MHILDDKTSPYHYTSVFTHASKKAKLWERLFLLFCCCFADLEAFNCTGREQVRREKKQLLPERLKQPSLCLCLRDVTVPNGGVPASN